ncbi:formyltransferase family protein [Thiohalorhabdus methylotrophus]|uniref:phosphoribosylglycinamide formyltransferase 1 n=1 Tax=Thiohalorhabdus methylotrophus TaxID=3242694 RepID=A0ABV4TW84_9GAMM
MSGGDSPRVLLLTRCSPFQVPIFEGINEGGGRVEAVVEYSSTGLSRPALWVRRTKRVFGDKWPIPAALRLSAAGEAEDPVVSGLIDKLEVDLVVVSRWDLLPLSFLGRFPRGVLNTHISLLPELRGKHPIPGALLAGMRRTGVTIHFLDAGIDTGAPLLQEQIPILEGDGRRDLEMRAAQRIRPMYSEVIRAMKAGRSPEGGMRSTNLPCHFSWKRQTGSEPPESLLLDWRAPSWFIARVAEHRDCHIRFRERDYPIRSVVDRGERPAGSGDRPGRVIAGAGSRVTVVTGEGAVDLELARGAGGGEPAARPEPGGIIPSGRWPRWQEFTAWVERLPASVKLRELFLFSMDFSMCGAFL